MSGFILPLLLVVLGALLCLVSPVHPKGWDIFIGVIGGISVFLLLYQIWRNHWAETQRQLRLAQSAHEQTQQALQRSERHCEMLVEGTGNAVLQLDHEGRLTYLNPALQRLLDRPATELIGQFWWDFLHAQDQLTTRQCFQRWQMEKSFHILHENCLIAGDGLPRNMLWNINPEFDHNGEVQHFNAIGHDITQEKNTETALLHAKNAAELANRAKSEFLANMSHEIRTPINAILGFTEILASRLTDPRQQKYVEAISSSSNVLLHLINDILDMSKIEAGKLHLEYAPLNLRALCEETGKIFAEKLRKKGLQFYIDYRVDFSHHFLLDEARMRQVLLNLVGNALKFTDQGYVKLSVNGQLQASLENTIHLHLQVEDSGIGIAEDMREKIFAAFAQQEGQSNRKYGGTGLGLTICQRLITLMGGNIYITQAYSGGSIFHVDLPNIKLAKADDLPCVTSGLTRPQAQFAPSSLLIADDESLTRLLLKEYLAEQPFIFWEATNGEETLDLAFTHLPNVILLDMKMPVMDGYSASKLLKEDQRTAHIPIIAISAIAIKEHTQQLGLFCDEYLYKPIQQGELLQVLARFLPQHRASHAHFLSTKTNSPNTLPAITHANYAHYQRLLDRLHDHHAQWQFLCERMVINELEHFGESMHQLGTQAMYPALAAWGETLFIQAELFQINELATTLADFPKILQQLQNHISPPGQDTFSKEEK